MNSRLALAAVFLAAAALCAPRAAKAKEDGQLWEVKTHMNFAGMPELKGRSLPPGMAERMGDNTTRVCRSADTRDMIRKDKQMRDCKIENYKESGATISMSLVCKRHARKGDIKMTYNKARTAYSGKVRMVDDQGHDMVMQISGKKVGSCDLAKAQQEKDQRREQISAMQAQAEEGRARADAANKQAAAVQIAHCKEAVEKMDQGGLGYYARCYSKAGKQDPFCHQLAGIMGSDGVAKTCLAKAGEFCRRYQTTKGYYLLSQSNGVPAAEQMCGVESASILPGLCRSALKSRFYEFVGADCPEQAAPLAKAHCAGRSFTAKKGDPRAVEEKWRPFCVAAAGRYMEGGDQTAQASSSDDGASQAQSPDAKGEAKKAVKKAVFGAFKHFLSR